MAALALAAIMATESEGVMKKCEPRIMLRSPSPSEAAPKRGAPSPHISCSRNIQQFRVRIRFRVRILGFRVLLGLPNIHTI